MATPLERTPNIVIVRTGDALPEVKAARGDFPELIQATIGSAWPLGYEVIDVRSRDPEVRRAPAYVITGSAANVHKREPWMLRTEAWLRELVALEIPVFGICFGHQILAQALGGEVQRNPRGREIGTIRIRKTGEDPLLGSFGPSFCAHATHIDSVVRLPKGAVSVACSDREDHHVIRFAETCYGVQFHPEMDAVVMRLYIEPRQPLLESEGFDVGKLLSEIVDVPATGGVLRRFVERVTNRP